MKEPEDAVSLEARLVQGLTMARVNSSEAHERFSLLTLGFVGALSGYLFPDKEVTLPVATMVALLSSLAFAVAALFLGHLTAIWRKGAESTDSVLRSLTEAELTDSGIKVALLAAAKWHYDRSGWIDKIIFKKLISTGLGDEERVFATCRIQARITQLQLTLVRLQMVTAVTAFTLLILEKVA